MSDTVANAKTIQLTQEGLVELQAELEKLKNEDLPAIITRVATARAHGDLSENAEYHNAKEDQQLLETRISEIEDILSRAQVVKQTTSSSKVGIGSRVTLIIKGKKEKHFTYQIVGEFEANPTEGKVSAVSPLGHALMNKKKGEEVTVAAPAGDITYVIQDIE